MPPISWSERVEARLARLEERLARLEALLGKPPEGLNEQMKRAAELLDDAAD